MQIKGEQFHTHLGRCAEEGLKPLYVLCGDAPLLILEATDAIRALARQQGYGEREVLTVLPGFDWSQLRTACGSLSLFGERKLIELRLPTGKPGRDGGAALQDYCRRAENPGAQDHLLLVTLGELDWREEKAAWFTQLSQLGVLVRFNAPALAELPGWLSMRLARQHQQADQEGLRFMAERVEGNLLAAHQELQKLALLYPPGKLSLEQIQAAVLNVARYKIDDLRHALLSGDSARFFRTLEGLRQEGEAPPLILWALTEEIRTLAQARARLAKGLGQEAVFRELRIWGERQVLIRRALSAIRASVLREALEQAADLDRMIKGVLKGDAWNGFLRLGMLLLKH